MQRNVEDRLANLSEQQRAALLTELRAARRRRTDPERIPRVGREDPLPLSFAQQRLWFLEEWGEGLPYYNTPQALRLRGPLDVDLLRAALTTVVHRHEMLRTRFINTDDGPRQLVTPAGESASLAVLDLTARSVEDREARTQRLAHDEARRPFDLTADQMLRATLVRLSDDEHVLILAMHHIATDGWSTERLVAELTECYVAGRAGRPPVLPDLPIQYADYAVWQRDRLASAEGAAQLRYWRDQLAGLATLRFPADRPRPANPNWPGALVEEVLPPDLHRDLAALAAQEKTRLLPVTVAGLAAVLSRYTGQDDIALGSVFTGRTRTEVEPLIGYFANTVVLRMRTGGDPTFRELVSRANEVVLAAHAHQDVPFEQVVNELRPDRDPSRNPLFQFALYQIGAKLDSVRMGDIELTGIPLHMDTARFDCTIGLSEPADGSIEFMAEYATDLFDRDRIARMLRHYRRVLECGVSRPDTRQSELELLTPAERASIEVGWNDTAVELPASAGVHAEFAAQAARTPDALAAVHDGVELTYNALDRRANQLANRLRALGARPGALVGVCLSRSLDMLVGVLATLKAGAAYVPLDPEYPAARLGYVLADAEPVVVLVDAASRDRLVSAAEPLAGAAPVVVDLGAQPLDQESDLAPDAGTDEHSLAYVIYTSGSTGRPKGVMVEHGQLGNLFTGLDQRFSDDSPGVWLAISSISFDMSGVELLWTLTRGFTVVVASGRPHELVRPASRPAQRPIGFGLFYFASDDNPGGDRYRLLVEGAKFADRHDFAAVWTPERHFHEFGGLYPSPSVTSAALAMVTERISIRAGSVVLPLHHPVRVAEEWSVIDNLSRGRVGVAFASGWLHDDFVFAPGSYTDRKQVMLAGAETVRKLWRGERVTLPGGTGKDVEIGIRPRPVQPELPVWLASGGTEGTFRAAAKLGANVLTHLLGQDLTELGRLIRVYHDAYRAEHGHDGGQVTLMLHAFVDPDRERALRTIRQPFINYLRTSLDLVRVLGQRMGVDVDAANISADDLDALLDHAFDRYVHTSGLFGTPEDCLRLIDQLRAIGVDEVACLVDFGVATDDALAALRHLNTVRELSNRPVTGDEESAENPSLAELIERYGVTHLQCTPALAQLMLDDETANAGLGSLRLMLVGGEAMPTGLAHRLRKALSGRLFNMYGPTETTIWSSAYAVDEIDDALGTVPIGEPLANTSLHVLDRWRQPLPVGVPGELYIGGAGVTRGYHRRPELTARHFLPDPFADPSGRLYRTGDLVRRHADGRLEFLGRADDQVKVRGFRVEPGEVENALREHPSVDSAVVVARGEVGAQQLVAYLIADGAPADSQQLREFARARLPEYMVPSRWMWLPEFPLNPNGKVDRAKLPEQVDGAAPGRSEPPRTDLERALAQVWCEILEIDTVGIRDNFFTLGGHSITVIRAVDLANRRGIRVTARQLFRHQTIAELAAAIGEAQDGAATGRDTLLAIKPSGTRPPLFCLHSSTGAAVAFFPLAGYLDAEQPCYGVQAHEIAPGAAFESIDELAARYATAIREQQPTGPYHLVGWSLGGGVAWAVASRLAADGAQVGLLAMLDTQPPTQLAEPFGHAEAVCAFADSVAISLGRDRLELDPAALRALAAEEQYGAVVDRLAAAGMVRPEEHGHMVPRARMFVAMTMAASIWRPAPFDGPVDLVLAADPGEVEWFVDGWRPHCAGALRTHLVPGDHFSMMQPANAAALGRTLQYLLAGAADRSAEV